MAELSEYMTLLQAAERVTVAGQRVNRRQLWRWAQYGVRGVKMRHARLGRQFLVREADIVEFIEELGRLDDAATPVVVPPRRVSRVQRDAEIKACQERLRQRGL